MKILICAGIFPPETGGPATYSKTLAEELVKRGHEVQVLTYTDDEEKLSIINDQFPIYGVKRSWFKPWHYWKYYRAVQKYGKWADIIYAQGPVSEGYPTYLAARGMKKPYVVKVVGDRSWEQAYFSGLTKMLPDEFQSQKKYPKKVAKMRQLQSVVCREAVKTIVPSKYLKTIVSGWGVDEKKISVIYNSVEIPDDLPDREQAKTLKGFQNSDFVVLSAGRDVPWKGFGTIKKAVDELRQDRPNIRLQIVHNVPHDDLLAYMRVADVFVLNSGYEGFSHLLLEAAVCGTAIIASDAGGNAELVEERKTGLLFEYDNIEQLKSAILKLYDDENLRRQVAENASKEVEKYSFKNMIDQLEDLMANVKCNM